MIHSCSETRKSVSRFYCCCRCCVYVLSGEWTTSVLVLGGCIHVVEESTPVAFVTKKLSRQCQIWGANCDGFPEWVKLWQSNNEPSRDLNATIYTLVNIEVRIKRLLFERYDGKDSPSISYARRVWNMRYLHPTTIHSRLLASFVPGVAIRIQKEHKSWICFIEHFWKYFFPSIYKQILHSIMNRKSTRGPVYRPKHCIGVYWQNPFNDVYSGDRFNCHVHGSIPCRPGIRVVPEA